MMKKVLIFGGDSFTGYHLKHHLQAQGYEVFTTSYDSCDLTQKEQIENCLIQFCADYIINLAAISSPAHKDILSFYRVNTIGTANLLESILKLELTPKKVILASSAAVYGNQNRSVLDESLCPQPANHYGASKLSMEHIARGYFSKLPILILRPFNYTGVGQSQDFLIPKIVSHFKNKQEVIQLGNLNVIREFNDVAFTCEAYKRLLESNIASDIFNIASNRGIKLLEVIEMMNNIAHYKIKIAVNPSFVRKDEILHLTGSNQKLFEAVGPIEQKSFTQTLLDIYLHH